jgi:serpin B
VILLVNAIYFKGLWRFPFNESETKEGAFQFTPTHSAKVPFMTMERELYWSESVELDSAIQRLPYMVSAGLCNTKTALQGECWAMQY